MPDMGNGGLDILPLMKGCVVHDNRASEQKFRQKVLRHSRIDNVGGDMGYEQAYGQECLSDQGADHMGSASCMPIFYVMATLTHWRIAMRARHVVSKAAFIKVDDDATFAFIAFNFLLEDTPLFFAGFGVTQAFFYKSRLDALTRD
ncbi:hypothetical protein SAMN05421863_10176 [Nitrosomonas communis]|uniref:Uncharacterized protein n=1 Tax=Nitrosomonas communis TaxID=44574 RepID=A0A1I4NY59_9PROT|nr:hypothetical protein SAMN05421863_10176 [Nitrosomonas communis]